MTALSRVVISQRERTVALRPMGDGLMAHTLYEDRDLNSPKELSTAWRRSRPTPRWCSSPPCSAKRANESADLEDAMRPACAP